MYRHGLDRIALHIYPQFPFIVTNVRWSKYHAQRAGVLITRRKKLSAAIRGKRKHGGQRRRSKGKFRL